MRKQTRVLHATARRRSACLAARCFFTEHSRDLNAYATWGLGGSLYWMMPVCGRTVPAAPKGWSRTPRLAVLATHRSEARPRRGRMSLSTFSVQDVARYCHVNQVTVEEWIRQGRLRVSKARSGQIRIPRAELRAFLQMNGLPVDMLFFATGGRPKRVLVVTDDQELVGFVVHSLCRSSAAIEVVSAADCDEAQCQATAAEPDLVILGHEVEVPDGLAICRWLSESVTLEQTKVLAVMDGDARRQSLYDVADDVARQPLDAGTFRLQVYAMLMNINSLSSAPTGSRQGFARR